MDLELLVNLLDLAGTFAFALVGARIAADKGLDYGGIAFIATCFWGSAHLGFYTLGYLQAL